MSKNSKVVRAPKRQRADNGKAKPKAGGKRRSSGGTRGEKAYWDKLGAEFEVSSEEDKNEWSDSDEETEEVRGDGVNYMKIAGDDEKQDEQDTASAIVRRWKQAQQKQQFPNLEAEVKAGEKRKIEAVTAADEDEDDDDELPETDEFENVNGEQDGEEEAKAEGEGQEDDDEEEMEAEEVPRVRKGPGSVSFAMVLGKLLSPEGEVAPQAEAEEKVQPVADPILKNFKKRTNRKLLAEKRRKREARELALKKKLLKARDHRIPTVLSEPGEVRLRKLATKGVVQLFNVVRKQQKEMAMNDTEELEKRNPLKAEKLTKTKFLELLQKTGGARKAGVKKEVKSEEAVKQEAKPAWDVLSDDYMLGASLKDLPDEDADE